MTAHPDLACQQFVELVTDYLEHALSPDEQARVEKHLQACDDCQAYLDQLRRIVTASRNLLTNPHPATEPVPPAMLDTLLTEFRRRDQR